MTPDNTTPSLESSSEWTTGRFRKKPVVIWAFRNDSTGVHPIWLGAAIDRGDVWYQGGNAPYYTIKTLEGEMRANFGDWIIRGVKGELYPCKPDIFAATYEPVHHLTPSPAPPDHGDSGAVCPRYNAESYERGVICGAYHGTEHQDLCKQPGCPMSTLRRISAGGEKTLANAVRTHLAAFDDCVDEDSNFTGMSSALAHSRIHLENVVTKPEPIASVPVTRDAVIKAICDDVFPTGEFTDCTWPKCGCEQVPNAADHAMSLLASSAPRAAGVGDIFAAPYDALESLRKDQRQLDQDGVYVGVSRQALDEVLVFIQQGGEG